MNKNENSIQELGRLFVPRDTIVSEFKMAAPIVSLKTTCIHVIKATLEWRIGEQLTTPMDSSICDLFRSPLSEFWQHVEKKGEQNV